MSHEPRATSRPEIAGWIREAATSEPWRPGHHLPAGAAALPEIDDFHSVRIEAALRRASRKTFVKMLKPFRRMFRNQGAVNDSLIEAATHLAAQNEGMSEQLTELRDLVSRLQTQVRSLLQQNESIDPSGAPKGKSAVGAESSEVSARLP